jgi:hypothetical protein
MKDYLLRLKTLNKFYALNPAADPAKIKSDLYSAMVEEAKIQILASQKQVSVSKKDIDSEYKFEAEQAGTSQFNSLLNSYSLNEKDFKDEVIKPALLNANLSLWHNKQADLNADAYKKMSDVQARMASGETLESLAPSYNEDQSSRLTEGDLGFLNSSELLPELLSELDAMKIGEVKVLVSRFGLHLTKLEAKDNNGPNSGDRFHIRQIFIPETGYENWAAAQTKNYTVKKDMLI